MHCIVYIGLNQFYIKTLGLDCDAAHCYVVRDGLVIDTNTAAQNKGIATGMQLGEAKMLAEGRGCYELKNDDYVEAQRAWLDVCATLTDVIEPEEFHSAYLDLSAHPDPIFILDRLRSELEALNWEVCTGTAGTRWVAKLAAQSSSQGPSNGALLTPRRFISGFKTCHLPIQTAFSERLSFLGYKTIGEVAEIELEVLRKQFGNEAIEIKRHAMGGGSITVRAFYPPNSITESFRYEGAPETYECFELGLKKTSDQVAEKLAEDDLVGERLDLFLEHEQGQITHCGRTFSKPYHSPKSLWSNVRLLVPSANTNQVLGLRLRAGDLRKLDRIQMEFEIGVVKSHRQEKASSALRQIHGVFGQESMKLGSQIQNSRRQRVLRAWRDANGWA
jgi:nucleotidyltransferase/DNA polymerase involved in DNA repair